MSELEAAVVPFPADDASGDVDSRPSRRADAARHATDRLVGCSPAMARVRDVLPRVARAWGSVLVQGPSGTGKELAARLVHDLSPRSSRPFIAVDCGSLAEGVLESELFGHARGAFTSAQGDRRGLFEEADGGTLFLDEISSTSLAFQARLLRVLQEGEVRKVGANRARPVDVRVIAASNRDLESDASAGRFRQDLFYRLDVHEITMPALRERREDVPLLARHVLREIERREGAALDLTARALSALVAHDWPGNVRELRNVLERAAALAPGGRVDVEHLPPRLQRSRPAREESASGGLEDLLACCERGILRDRLESHGWNRTRTAAELGITRRCLFNKILKLGLAADAKRGSRSVADDFADEA